MKNYLMLGDTHGDLDFVERAAYLAAEHDATIIQVGDWSFVWPGSNQLEALNAILVRAGEQHAKPPVQMRFIDGNHDWHDRLEDLSVAAAVFGGRPHDHGVHLTDNVVYQMRGTTWTDEDGTRFLFCGGAPSIDRWNRTEGRSWWPTEFITEEQYANCLAVTGKVDVLVTHDAPDYPPGYKPLGSPEFREQSRRSMEMVAGMIEKHQPQLHVHGHWHDRYLRKPVNGDGTVTIGLDCNLGTLSDAVLLWSKT